LRGGAWIRWVIAGAFLGAQIALVAADANGPFVDEGLYVVAGLRVLEGQGPADGYARWFNGSPFAWPVLAALGFRVGGLAGVRLVAAVLSTVTLIAFAAAAERLLGRRVAAWGAGLLALNGLFLALAHFAVYDVPALTGLAMAMYALARAPAGIVWPILGGIAFAAAVVAKYGYLAMAVPLLGLLVAVRGLPHAVRPAAAFLGVSGAVVGAYFLAVFGAPYPSSASAYLGQTLVRSRAHIAALQLVFTAAPLALMAVGALAAWRARQRWLVATCAVAVSLYPTFHLWSANFVSSQKHAVAGFLFAYLLAGVTLDRLWRAGRRPAVVWVLAVLTAWGALQCYWQDRSWSDVRPLVRHLIGNMRPGDRILAESPWSYAMYLYPTGIVDSPFAVIDTAYAAARADPDGCAVPWLVGDPAGTQLRDLLARCPHRLVRSIAGEQYYLDTTRLRVGRQDTATALYRLP